MQHGVQSRLTEARVLAAAGRVEQQHASDRPVPPVRKVAFVLASTDQGSFIVNRFDYKESRDGRRFGVGFKLLNESSFELSEISVCLFMLESRRKLFGDGVVAVDCGANIGTHTVDWARQMTGWGSVTAIEAQERIYYALAGNVSINNCFNTRLIHAVVGNRNGFTRIPELDHFVPTSFGSLELRPTRNPEDIGQKVDYSESSLVPVRAITIDSLALKRLDLLKIDVEGMELEVLEGARRTIKRCSPVILIEKLKSNVEKIGRFLQQDDYLAAELGINLLAIHAADKAALGLGP
ncbi:MAG TPA: FkbM family methyltransferase [Acetobacteraceae bacterium]|nr:FkbM family methyltransferase [Acetobacteraceae bacterium]